MSILPVEARITNPAAGRPAPRATELVICTACEVEEFTAPGVLPNEWAVEACGDQLFAFCPDCKVDLPQGTAQ